MNARKRKKWQKKHGLYVNRRECFSLYYTIASFVLPRLKQFKKDTIAYPGSGEMDTPEKWDAALDKMILAFEYIVEDEDWWIGNPKYDYTRGLHLKFDPLIDEDDDYVETSEANFTEEDWVEDVRKAHNEEAKRRQLVIEEGLQLFAKWFQHLWW